jgi:4-hydroxy-tetrahydrodipicolinate synthase
VDIGMWLFDAGYSGYHLSPELTARIAGLENVCGIKLGNTREHYAAVHRLCGDRIVMSHPSEEQWLPLLRDFDQRVHMSSPAPYLMQTPGYLPIREYSELGLSGQWDAAAAASARLADLRAVYEKWMGAIWQRHRIVPDAYLKAWCELLGMAGGPVRPPLPQITEAERAEMRADLERVGLLARVPTPA